MEGSSWSRFAAGSVACPSTSNSPFHGRVERRRAVQGKATEVGRSSRCIGDEITVLIYCQRAVLYQMGRDV
jgi:hypothetical protein